jgi:hypothetical protein
MNNRKTNALFIAGICAFFILVFAFIGGISFADVQSECAGDTMCYLNPGTAWFVASIIVIVATFFVWLFRFQHY